MRKKQVEMKKKQAELDACTDPLDARCFEIEILELGSHLDGTQNAVNGAIVR